MTQERGFVMETNRRGRRLLHAGLVVLVVALLAWTAPALWVRLFGPDVVNNALVGQTESQVRQGYGAPVSEYSEYLPLGLRTPQQLPSGPFKTLIFKLRGPFHLESGWQWAWFAQREGEWICLESCWFADGVKL